MPSYKFAKSAQIDLVNIIDYTIETWGVEQSSVYIDGLELLIGKLAESPEIGKFCHHLIQNIRVFSYQSHLIYYMDNVSGILIVRVLHKNMSPTLHLKPEGKA